MGELTIENKAVAELFSQELDMNRLEEYLNTLPPVDAPVSHHFSEGVYTRTIFIPKDTLILGKRHRFETCNILLEGEISIYMGKDQPVVRLKAPCIFNSKPFVRKLGYAHTDVLFSNIHPTKEHDIDVIEQEFIMPETDFIEMREAELCLGAR